MLTRRGFVLGAACGAMSLALASCASLHDADLIVESLEGAHGELFEAIDCHAALLSVPGFAPTGAAGTFQASTGPFARVTFPVSFERSRELPSPHAWRDGYLALEWAKPWRDAAMPVVAEVLSGLPAGSWTARADMGSQLVGDDLLRVIGWELGDCWGDVLIEASLPDSGLSREDWGKAVGSCCAALRGAGLMGAVDLVAWDAGGISDFVAAGPEDRAEAMRSGHEAWMDEPLRARGSTSSDPVLYPVG